VEFWIEDSKGIIVYLYIPFIGKRTYLLGISEMLKEIIDKSAIKLIYGCL